MSVSLSVISLYMLSIITFGPINPSIHTYIHSFFYPSIALLVSASVRTGWKSLALASTLNGSSGIWDPLEVGIFSIVNSGVLLSTVFRHHPQGRIWSSRGATSSIREGPTLEGIRRPGKQIGSFSALWKWRTSAGVPIHPNSAHNLLNNIGVGRFRILGGKV